jgi:hypothetical protein
MLNVCSQIHAQELIVRFIMGKLRI